MSFIDPVNSLCTLAPRWQLPRHLDLYLFFFLTTIWKLSLTSRLNVEHLFDPASIFPGPPSKQVTKFYESFGELNLGWDRTVGGFRKPWPQDHLGKVLFKSAQICLLNFFFLNKQNHAVLIKIDGLLISFKKKKKSPILKLKLSQSTENRWIMK